MANLEKLVKALEALKVFQPGGVLQEEAQTAKWDFHKSFIWLQICIKKTRSTMTHELEHFDIETAEYAF